MAEWVGLACIALAQPPQNRYTALHWPTQPSIGGLLGPLPSIPSLFPAISMRFAGPPLPLAHLLLPSLQCHCIWACFWPIFGPFPAQPHKFYAIFGKSIGPPTQRQMVAVCFVSVEMMLLLEPVCSGVTYDTIAMYATVHMTYLS